MFLVWGMTPDEIAGEIYGLKAKVRLLIQYTRHKYNCATESDDPGDCHCDCGLRELVV